MNFLESGIRGAWIIDPERHEDERGFFARSFCMRDFQDRGLEPAVAQCNISYNDRKGTLRGMHSQRKPYEEVKLVRCTRGAIHDVIIDLRRDSQTYMQSFAIDLTAENRLALYVPAGVYHGFLTLEDRTEIFYQMSRSFVPDQGLGVRWDDPAFGIEWPIEVALIAPRDAGYPDYDPS